MASDLPVPGENPELDAETQVPILVGTSIAFAAASAMAVGLRLYTRGVIVKALGTDDVTIVFAQILSIGVSVVTILQAKYALGVHVWMTTPEGNIAQLKALFAGMVLYNLSQIVTKVSFLLQYRRIFSGRTRTVCLWFIAYLIAWGITQEVLVGMSCVPVAVFVPSRQGSCVDALAVWYLTSIMNIVTDFAVFTTPMPAIRRLALRRRQKIMVASIFGLGFFTCIISIVRLFTLRSAINTVDPTWDNVPTSYWTVIELNCGILCACLPTLRPLLRRVFPSLDRSEPADSGKGSLATIGEQSLRKKRRGLYTLTTTTVVNDSQEDVKEAYKEREYARHSGKTSRVTTAVHGGRGRGWIDEGITVTREIGMQESVGKQ